MIYGKALVAEGIGYRDFLIPSLTGMSLEGGMREGIAEITGLEMGQLEEDELHDGMHKVNISFTLKKGSYATMAVKALFLQSLI